MEKEIIIVEIPHQRKPVVYTMYEDKIIQMGIEWAEPEQVVDTLQNAIDVLSYDLHKLLVIKNKEDYDTAVKGDTTRGDHGHQYAKYIGALRREGKNLNYE